MFSWRFCLFSVLTVLCVGSSHAKRCVDIDKHALVKLKYGFADGRNVLSSWKGEDCCEWKGISCNNLTAHVTRLDLGFSYLTSVLGTQDLNDHVAWNSWTIFNTSAPLGGKIDSSICELQHLTFLDLSFNDLEGEIPKCIGSLGQLIELKLARNNLVGSVSHFLANLSNLQNLDLGHNNLVANELEWISHLSNLRYLDLSNINLGRAIDWPSSISKIPYLVDLYLDDCEISQVNPKSIPHMNSSTSLQTLSLSQNKLNSSILSWVLNVSKVLTRLDLSFNSLHSVPDDFANMISLQYLDLSGNELDGSIVKSLQTLYQLKDLEGLALNQNPFSSGLLPDFSRLSSLKTLSLRNTNIVGSLSLDHLPHLEDLDLSFNHLNGSLPIFEVTKFAMLSYLDLSHNKLSGTLPYTIGQLSNLSVLHISSNMLSGIISEEHLLNLSRLETLDVSRNSLSFNFNPNWVPPFQLRLLFASSCLLGPQFPTWLKYQRKLLVLQISNSGIKDSFPKWFWDISSSLEYLNVSHNKLSGVLPRSLRSIKGKDLIVCDFSFNNFSGPLPHFALAQSALLLSNNMFSGSLSSFCAMSPMSLTYLDLSSNLLAGSLLDCWEKFQSLEVLNLANNNLSGTIPKSFGTLQNIESMHLNNNNFSGKIPSLTLCKSLRVIDFGDNIIEGTLPTWVGHNLHGLIVLSLRGNKIQGNIPTSLCNLLFLQVLDLSANNITGKIPQCFGYINAFSNLTFPRKTILYYRAGYIDDTSSISSIDETILAWKGQIRKYGKNLGFMTIIDLSDNHLTGEIPQSLTTLVALAGLNLSGNNLIGFIPNNIGHMKMLESLDLSRNYLYGRMPQSFSNLTFLSYMNLSLNNLSGKIPVSSQLQSFDASTYVGNIGLCGPPLTNQCPDDVVPATERFNKNGANEDEDELINFGFYISLGFGFFVGFWGVCGTLIIKSSWRHVYFQFFNNVNDWIWVTLVLFIAKIDSSICELQHLTFLDLTYNDLEGEIPKCIGSLGRLIELKLADNELSLANLSNLQNLDLQFYHGKVLTHLDLPSNSLHTVPNGLENMNSLQYPHLSHNEFDVTTYHHNRFSSRPLPGLLHLEHLDLSFNHLSGSLHIFEVTKFDSLHILDLSHNELSGTLPYTIGQLSNLTTLSLSSNKLNSIIGKAHLISLSRLETLDVS
ncbi:LRR receptor-like serine/threonine-protein kinase GSO1, partial [Mucuna pruriens]